MRRFQSRKSVYLAIILAIIIFSGLVGQTDATASENKPVNLKIATYQNPAYGTFFYVQKMLADYINLYGRKCNLSAEFYHSGTVYKAKELLPACISGSLDIVSIVPPYLEGSIPSVGVSSLPFVWKNMYVQREAEKRGTPLFKCLDNEFDKRGLLILGLTGSCYMNFVSNKPLTKLEDWKGIKVRVSGPIYSKAMKAIGAIPVSMPSGEVYTSLQRGVVDAAMASDVGIRSRKLGEVTKYQSIIDAFAIDWIFFMNKEKFNSLSKEQQKVVLNAGEVARFGASVAEASTGVEGYRLSLAADYGVKVLYATEKEKTRFKKAMQPVISWWIKKMGKTKAEEILKALHDSENPGLPKWGKLDLILPE